jgi:DNA-3-methyladenine glycosylase I
MPRCPWAKNELAIKYHDEEWGRPVRDDRTLFEFLILEGAQAGLSWDTVLKKRERYREVFSEFDPAKVARFTPARVERILADGGGPRGGATEGITIVRNRLKVEGAVRNARAFLKVQEEFAGKAAAGFEPFAAYLWSVVDGEPIINRPRTFKDVPATTPISDAMSRDLKKRGFTFVGSTIVYALMQACGLVNDHVVTCEWK